MLHVGTVDVALCSLLSQQHNTNRFLLYTSQILTSSLFSGFRGRTRPNLLRQETTSLGCALRILYRMLADGERADDYLVIEERLLRSDTYCSAGCGILINAHLVRYSNLRDYAAVQGVYILCYSN